MDIEKLFSEYLIIIRRCFPGEYSDRHALGAFMCVLEKISSGSDITEEKIRESKNILKRRVNITTAFRDYLMLPITLRMAMSDDPSRYIDGLISTFIKIKPSYFTGTGQRLITAMAIYENTPIDKIDDMCSKTYLVYEEMKNQHPLLTGQEDMAFAALLAIDNENLKDVIEEMEQCFDLLRERFTLGISPIQNVSHVLAMTNIDNKEKTEKFITLYNELKEGRTRFGRGPQLIVLAVLSVLDISAEDAALEVKKFESFLKTQKGFGPLGTINIYDRRMIAVALIAAKYLPKDRNEIYDVKVDILRIILRSAMIGCITVAKSSLAMSAHR